MQPDNPWSARESSGRSAPDQTDLPALDWMRRAHAEEELLAAVSRRVGARRRSRLVMASGALALVLAGGLVWNSDWRRAPVVELESSLTAKLSAPERRVLPDASVIELKEGAQVDVDYSGRFRRVKLQRGEALFQVAKDASRPFIVEAAGVKVRAVGTAFSVQLDPERQVEVLVTEGRVQVAPVPETTAATPDSPAADADAVSMADMAGFAAGQPVMLAGYRATIGRGRTAPEIVAVSVAEIADRLAWRVPSLEFSRTPLPEVIGLMNRYATGGRKVRFVIADAELNTIKLTGFLRTDNSEGLVRLLENNFGVEAGRAGDRIILRGKR